MNRVARAHQGDTLDALIQRIFGQTAELTEQALLLNPGLAEQGPILAEGTAVTLPEPPRTRHTQAPIHLWS